MTQQEIQERNKQIALMLGVELHESQLSMPHSHYTCYHSDWNWLMEAVEFIENLNNIVHISGNEVCIDGNVLVERNITLGGTMNSYNEKYYPTLISITEEDEELTKKEAVFIAVSDFAKRYNNKEI